MKKLDITSFVPENVVINGDRFCFAKNGGKLQLNDFKAEAGKFLVIDITNEYDGMARIRWGFNTTSGRSLSFRIGMLPRLRTRLALPFDALDGSVLFLPRTPGKLKTLTEGSAIPIDEVNTFWLSVNEPDREQVLTIHDMYISDCEPDYPLPDGVKMVDALGQKRLTDWKGKTHSEAELCEYLNSVRQSSFAAKQQCNSNTPNAASKRSRFGGWTDKYIGSPNGHSQNGYFSLHNDGRRWWLVDPDGYAFFSMGLDCVGVDGDCNLTGITGLCESLPPHDGSPASVGWRDNDSDYFSFHKANLYRAFGDSWYDSWSSITAARMNEWGFNTIACWSDLKHARRVKQPYTYIFSGRPLTEKKVFRDFPDVFSPEYRDVCREWAKQILPFADDKYLLGYFMGNEPQWAFINNFNIAKMLLEDCMGFVSRERLTAYLAEKYGDISSLNAAWESSFESFDSLSKPAQYNETAEADLWSFTAELIREYMRVPSEEIRKLDRNHLNLGIRYAWLSSEVIASGSEYVDIFSFNCYQMDPTKSLADFYSKVKKPLIIGEFHFGALDVGLDATGLRAVASQQERGNAYRYYMQKAAACPYCLGAHYFTLNDQAYLGRFDGENFQIGVVDVCQRPYEGFVDGIVKTHSELYDIADGRLPADAPAAVETNTMAF